MDWLAVTFPVSGVQTQAWLPPLVAFVKQLLGSLLVLLALSYFPA